MAARDILKMGDVRLLKPARAVQRFDTPELHELVQDLFDTMRVSQGVGLAAPQIGVDLAVVVLGGGHSERYPDAPTLPLTVLINPQIEALGDEQSDDWEACLSVPGMRGVVARHARIRYRAQDAFGRPLEAEVDGFAARVVQHECDHLEGKLYPMRVTDFSRFGFTSILFPGRSGGA